MYLNCHTYFSFKFGTMKPEELLQQAVAKGVRRFVVSDINNTSAILDCHRFVTEYPDKYPVQPIAGIDFRKGVEQKFIGIAKNITAFLN
ncbi:MAG: PHP domain-containing protein [Chitinophagales bacterium]